MLPRSCAREGQGWPDTFGQGTSIIKLKLPHTKTLDYHDGGWEEDPQDDIRTGGGDTNPTQHNWLLVSKRVPLLSASITKQFNFCATQTLGWPKMAEMCRTYRDQRISHPSYPVGQENALKPLKSRFDTFRPFGPPYRGGQKHVIRVSFFGNGTKRIYYWRKSQLRKSKHDKLIMVINTQNGVSNIMWLSIENRRKYFVVRLSFKSWDLWKLDIVSDIGFRASPSPCSQGDMFFDTSSTQ